MPNRPASPAPHRPAAAFPQRGATLAAAILLSVAVAYLLRKSVFNSGEAVDFHFLWSAGRAWGNGVDPYSDAYVALDKSLFHDSQGAPWFYPPQWWPILRPLAMLPADLALRGWRTGNAALLSLGAVALVRAMPRAGIAVPNWAALIFVALPMVMGETSDTLTMGQSSLLILGGYFFYARGLVLSDRPALVLGLFLLLLKPQFGVPAAASLLLVPRCRGAIAIAGAATLAACLPQIATHGLGASLSGFLINVGRYGGMPVNNPTLMTGFNHLQHGVLGVSMSNVGAALLSIATSMAATLLIRSRRMTTAQEGAGLATAHIAIVAFFLQLHVYDFVIIVPVATLAMAFCWRVRLLAWAGVALCLRASNWVDLLAVVAPLRPPLMPLAMTMGALLVLLATVAIMLGKGHPLPISSGRPTSLHTRPGP